MSKKVAEKHGSVLVSWYVDDDPQKPKWFTSRTRPYDACQGRQARRPGSDVTATADVNNSFKCLNMFAAKDLLENSLKSDKTPPARTKKAIPAASGAILTFFSRNCAYLRQDFSTFVAETRESRCLSEDPCGVLW